MSTPRDIVHPPQDLALKLASREAVEAAGGGSFVAGEVGRSAGRISDYISSSTPDFMPIDIVRRVEALGAGKPGHPHITRALARAQGQCLTDGSACPGGLDDMGDWLARIASEGADIARVLASQDLSACVATLSANSRAALGREAGHLIELLQVLRREIDGAQDEGVAGDGAAGSGPEGKVAPLRRSTDSS